MATTARPTSRCSMSDASPLVSARSLASSCASSSAQSARKRSGSSTIGRSNGSARLVVGRDRVGADVVLAFTDAGDRHRRPCGGPVPIGAEVAGRGDVDQQLSVLERAVRLDERVDRHQAVLVEVVVRDRVGRRMLRGDGRDSGRPFGPRGRRPVHRAARCRANGSTSARSTRSADPSTTMFGSDRLVVVRLGNACDERTASSPIEVKRCERDVPVMPARRGRCSTPGDAGRPTRRTRCARAALDGCRTRSHRQGPASARLPCVRARS